MIRGMFTYVALKLPGAPRLSNFEMIVPPATSEELHQAILTTIQQVAESSQRSGNPMGVLRAQPLEALANKMAVAEVDLTTGIWPFRTTARKRIIRPSHSRFWAYQEGGEWTPGNQAEELERRWAITQDFQRQSLSRSLEKQFSSIASGSPDHPEAKEGGDE